MKTTNRVTVAAAEEILNLYQPVLDKGFISLTEYMGGDELIEANARVSYQKGTRKVSDRRNLIRYLVRQDHGSPLEAVTFRFHVKCPIFVMRQWIRHRIASYSELSGRYSVMETEFYTPTREDFALQSTANKQGRANIVAPNTLYEYAMDHWNSEREDSNATYQGLLDGGLARELARIDLPLSTYTEFVWTINLRSLMNFLTLRTDEHAQKEIRNYAYIVAAMVQRVCPIAYEAWEDYERDARTFSRQEMDILRNLVRAVEDANGNISFDARSGIVTSSLAENYGLSKREVKELYEKLTNSVRWGYTLDPSQMLSADSLYSEGTE